MNKRFLTYVAVSLMVATFFIISMASGVAAQTPSENFNPVDDTDVNEGNPDSNPGGTDYNMYVGYVPGDYLGERAFLKFDLSDVPDIYVDNIDNAVLSLMSKYGPSSSETGFPPENLWVSAKGVDNDSWNEETLTWNRMGSGMTMGSTLDNVFWQADDYVGEYARYSWDVTSFVKDQITGDDFVTLALVADNAEAESKDAAGWFYQIGDNKSRIPYLYLNGLEIPYRIPEVSPGFGYRDAIPGGTVTVPVNITNKGNNVDNIVLSVDDDAGWSPTIPSKVEIPGGKSKTVDVTVSVPDNAAYMITDNIEITASSEAKSSLSTSENFEVYTSTWVQPPDDDRHIVENQDAASSDDSKYWLYAGANAYDNEDDIYYNDERIYMKFDLENGGLPSDYPVENVFLYLYAYDVNENEAGRNIELYEVANDNWKEENVGTAGWSNQPKTDFTSGLIGAENIVDEGYYKWNVTSYINEQRGVDNVVSFCFKAEDEDPAPGENFSYGFVSKAGARYTNWISLAQEPHLAFGVRPVVSNITDNDGVLPGENAVVDVIINNRGSLADTYNVSISSDRGWTCTPASTSVSVEPGENVAVPVTVDIPSGTSGRTWENLEVTVTSSVDNDFTETYKESVISVGYRQDLVAGWNLVGFPGADSEATPENMMPANYTMYYWNAPRGPYDVPFGTQPVEDNVGYWVNVDQDWYIRTSLPPASATINLKTGWNLVHFPVTSEDTTPDNLFSGVNYTMYYWNAPRGPYGVPFEDEPVEPGVGYWVKVENEAILTVPV